MEDTVITETIYHGPLGRIVAVPSQKTLDAWDWRGEYLGGFTTPDRAKRAMKEAKEVHESLRRAYQTRKP